MVVKSQLLAFSVATVFTSLVTTQESGKCEGQSCYIAYISGSSKTKYDLPAGKAAAGANASGEKCITEYLGKLGVPLPTANAKATFLNHLTGLDAKIAARSSFLSVKFDALKKDQVVEEARLEKRQTKVACKPYTLLYSRGTLEPGALGVTLGPQLSKEMGKKKDWNVQAVTSIGKLSYKASASDNYCVGLPGGYVCKNVLNKLSDDCPDTKIVVGGYSQGAMVSRICVAYASEKARAQVKVCDGAKSYYKTPQQRADKQYLRVYCFSATQ